MVESEKARLLFLKLTDKARAAGAKASSAAKRLFAARPRAAAALALATVASIATLSLSASAEGFGAQDRAERFAAEGRNYFRAGFGLSNWAYTTTERASLGLQGWTPTGITGWESYDTSTPGLIRRNLSFEQARMFNALLESTATPVKPLSPFVLDASASDEERALHCLSQAIYYEAGFESAEGQQAVAQVVLNRLRHPNYPKSVCGVVYQGSQRTTGCQFSFTCDGSLNRPPAQAAWIRSRAVAQQALNGFVYGQIGTATHYHADYVFPYWAPTLVKLRQIGAHIFYRMTGPAGSPDGFGGRYAGNEAYLTAAVLTGGDARTPDAPSAVTPAAPALPPMQMVSLTIGGETKTYQVGASGMGLPLDVAAASTDAAAAAAQMGALARVRRQPTADEIKAINEKLKAYEDQMAARETPKATVATE